MNTVGGLDGLLSVLGGIVVVATVLGTGYAVLRTKGRDATVNLLEQGIEARDAALAWEKELRLKEKQECDTKIAELSGRVDTLQSSIVQELVGSMRAEIREAVVGMTAAVERLIEQRQAEK